MTMIKKVRRGVGYGLVGLILLGWLQDVVPHNHKLEAYEPQVACEVQGKDYLKAPSTAEFSGIAETITAVVKDGKNEKSFVVRGWVEAQNSFGVPLKSPYICTVVAKRKDETSEWDKKVTAFVVR